MKGRNLDYGHMYEGRMVRTELDNIKRNAKQLHDMLHDEDNLPEWVNKKVFLSNSYLKSAKDYLHNKLVHRVHTKKNKNEIIKKSKKNKNEIIKKSKKNKTKKI
jgi:hypothetical protein